MSNDLNPLFISLWAYLFCIPLSQPGQMFGWLKGLISRLPEWLYLPLIGCPKCHAGQVALWWQVVSFTQGGGFNIPFILIAISGAYFLETWHLFIQKWLNR